MRNRVVPVSTCLRHGGLVIFLIFFLLWAGECLMADSIWAKRASDMRSLYADDVARNIGDILTVKISEASKIDNKAKRDLKKETDKSTTFNGELNIGHLLPSMPGFIMAAKSTNGLKGKADYKDERSFVDKITVVVVDILPNGNLVIMGTRDRNIAGVVCNNSRPGVIIIITNIIRTIAGMAQLSKRIGTGTFDIIIDLSDTKRNKCIMNIPFISHKQVTH